MRRLSCLLLCLLATSSLAHEGEAHEEARAPVASMQGEVHALSATGDVFEVVLKHPAHGEGGKTPLRVFVAEVDTNAPVSGAQVELTLTGPTTQALTPKMDSPGVYRVEAELPLGAEFAAVATVTRGETVDVLTLGEVHIEADESPSAQGAGASTGWLVGVVALVGALGLVAWGMARRMRRVTP
jgi:hypothetical protein